MESLVRKKLREHAQRNVSVFPRNRKRNLSHLVKPQKKRPMFVFILWVVFGGVVLYVAFFGSFLRIESFNISGITNVSEEAVRSIVFDEIHSKFLSFIPRDTFFMIPEKRIQSMLLLRFPMLSSVSFHRQFPNSFSIVLSERDRILLYCSGGPCFLVDDEGILRDAHFAETEENHPFTIFLIDESAKPVNIGSRLFPREQRDALLSLERSFREEFSFGIANTIVTPTIVSNEYRLQSREGWTIFTNLSFSPKKTSSSLRLVLANELPVEKRSKLRYIDLRAENRIFYAIKEEQGEKMEGEKRETEDEYQKEKKD